MPPSFREILAAVRDSLLSAEEPPRTAEEINEGWCADFADAVWRLFGDGVEVVNDEDLGNVVYTHTFLKLGDRYYDSECLDGVDDWRQLPCLLRVEEWLQRGRAVK